jgi:apolipoprotein N-acyltransferase
LNSAYLITPEKGIADRGAKRFLVPFGERVPFQAIIPALGNLNFGQAEFLPDLTQNIFEVSTKVSVCRFPVLICYESAFSGLARDAVLSGANFLVTISNDGWYGSSSEPHQIAALSRFRCIETRRSMARAANTGISLIADPLGRVISSSALETSASNSAAVPLVSDITFYVKHGNWFLILVTLIYGVCLTFVLFRKLKF